MADQDLKKQLNNLFSDLTSPATPLELSALVTIADEEYPTQADQLAGLFSDLPDPAQIDEPPAATRADRIAYQLQRPQAVERSGLPLEAQPGAEARDQATRLIEDDAVAPVTSGQISDPRQAAHNLSQVTGDRSHDALFHTAAHPDPDVAGLALKTLVEMGDAIKSRVLALAQQPKVSIHPGARAYLSYLLAQPVIYIPPGSFLMGSNPTVDERAGANEQPPHNLVLPGYWIARHPVTMAGFRAFIQESGYRFQGADDLNGPADRPVVGVTWNDALVYCRWLSERSGLPVTLPNEAEWEKAARGTDGRRYPWGNQQPTTALCNVHHITPVGHYSPQGDSPYGCADMAGSVWEWTRSTHKPYPYQPEDGRETLDTDRARVVRGVLPRCAFRYRLKPDLRLPTLGFRIVVFPL